MRHIIWRNKLDRQIVYPGAIPLETDLLNTNRFTMIAIAKLAASVMGSNTYLNGLACTASSPASMVINIAPGEIYSLQNIDSTAYSSLPADTAHSILKQGILLSATSFTLAAPSTAGQSINYLIQVAFQDVDSGATVLPYYNASNPSQAYSGPNNSGIAQNTIRSGVCSVSVKTGVSATTGSQVTPPPDAGYVGAYVVTVNQGQTTITSTSINLAANAPFLPKNGLVSGVQSNTMNYSADTGTANNYVASYFPAVTQLTDGLRLTFKAKNSNTASSTFSPNGLASAPIYTRAAGALTGGEIAQNKIMEVEWNSTLSAWTLISGSDPLAIGALQKSANLYEIKDAGPVAVAQTLLNLGLGDAAKKNVGTTSGTVAAGDDSRIVNAISSKNTNVSLPGALTTVSDSRAARFLSKSDVVAGEDRAEGHATLAVDGNVHGTVWGGALSTYINNLRNTASMGTNGWHRDATTGLIMQWVKGAPSSGSNETIVNLYFPIVFPSICLFASAGTLGTGSSSENKMFQTITWAIDFVQLKPQDMASSGGTVYPLVFAIGY
ncbi:gp53-like domain-containing protein [Yersinia enterocolitica]|uniref:gp53-like domain-containing protein n=1 Tax=Yersinia enterocolitica TaxID=630 RepID=UPI003D02FCD2